MSDGFLAALDHSLRAPLLDLDIDALRDVWSHDDVVVIADLPAGFEDLPDINMRLRGALGRELKLQHHFRPRRIEPFGRPSAWQLLWDYQPPETGSLRVARPMTLHVMIESMSMTVRVRLFGHARICAPEVLDALVAAMAGGVRLRHRGIRVAVPPVAAAIERVDGVVPWRSEPTVGMIRMRSPTQVRRGSRLLLEPAALLLSAVRRVAGLAPWMDVRLRLTDTELQRKAEDLRYRMDDALPISFERHSQRHPLGPIPVFAIGGVVRIQGRLAPFVPFLQLAEFTGIGSSAALGFGQVECICW